MLAVDNKALVLDLLEWIGVDARDYAELMEAWRTSCPRLPIWEDAVDHGFVACGRAASSAMVVRVTPAGRRFLEAERPALARREG
ncbi:MAG TPA: hypothetical protein VIH21_10025 [Dehalococcoidia bacterium]